MKLLLVPGTRENLKISIEHPVDIDFAKKYLSDEFLNTLVRQSGNEGVRCWAVTKNTKTLFDNINNGDEVLLTEKGTGLFTHYGIIIGKTQNESFGRALWPISGDNPWEYIYFLANIHKIRIDKKKFVVELGYKESFTVPGSIIAKNDYLEKIGSISKNFEIPVFDYIAENYGSNDYSASNIESIGTRRQGHANFSKEVKQNYNYKCAVCGITETEFLLAGHISGWAEDKKNRLNPSNGLCLCPLHDKAFEHGYISLDNAYKIIINTKINKKSVLFNELDKYNQKKIFLPIKSLPDLKLLQNHRERHNL